MLFSTTPAQGLFNKPFRRWTLVSRLGYLLNEAELAYGPRDLRWTVLGIEFSERGPMIWFPGDRMHVAILLSEAAATDQEIAVFQLVQEIVHLLAPLKFQEATYAEEGVATIFAESMLADLDIKRAINDPKYMEAKRRVADMNTLDQDSVKHLRLIRPDFSTWDQEFLTKNISGMSDTLANELCELFPTNKP